MQKELSKTSEVSLGYGKSSVKFTVENKQLSILLLLLLAVVGLSMLAKSFN